MRLIDADGLHKKIDAKYRRNKALLEVHKEIDNAPTIEAEPAEPVVHGEWINIEDSMPEEYDSIFADLYGTDEWNDAMFRKTSDDVNVVWEYDNGTRVVKIMSTEDGEFREPSYKMPKSKPTHWMPLPEPPEREE